MSIPLLEELPFKNEPELEIPSTHHGRLKHRLSLHRFQEQDVGNGCQFQCLSMAIHNNTDRHAEIRAIIVEQIEKNLELYVEFIKKYSYIEVSRYLEVMAKLETPGDLVTLGAAANEFEVKFSVFTSGPGEFLFEPTPWNRQYKKVIYLSCLYVTDYEGLESGYFKLLNPLYEPVKVEDMKKEKKHIDEASGTKSRKKKKSGE